MQGRTKKTPGPVVIVVVVGWLEEEKNEKQLSC
jgi:hypothetical protein